MTVTHRELDLGMSLFLELIQADPALHELTERCRGEYFPSGGAFSGDPEDAPAAEMRYLEWMLFERDHEGALLVETLLPEWRSMASPELAAQEAAYLGTSVGMFLVGSPAGDGLHWLKDIAGLGEYAVELRAPTGTVGEGSLIVGRLYPGGDSAHILSPGAGCFEDEELLSAVQRDLDLARKSGQRKALRMRQPDLEAMFWGSGAQEATVNPTEELRSFLTESGLEVDEVAALIEALSQQPLPEDTSSPLVAGYLGDLLDHLAFNTEVDLDLAQERLLSCWVFLQGPAQESVESGMGDGAEPQEFSPKEALAAFDQDRGKGLDAEASISRLCARLGIDIADETELDATRGEADGAVVSNLLTEFLWDVGRTEGESAAAEHAHLSEPLSTLKGIYLIEELSAKRLLLMGCTTLCEDQRFDGDQLEASAKSLHGFCSWCVEHHGALTDETVEVALQDLPQSLKRVWELNKTLSGPPVGEWYQLEDSNGELIVRGEDGANDGVRLKLPGLRGGDFVRGRFAAGDFLVSWCYPDTLAAAR